MTIETLKQAEDGNGLILRIFEHANRRVTASVRFGIPVRSVSLVNLIEEGEEMVAIVGNAVTLKLRSFEIATLRMQYSAAISSRCATPWIDATGRIGPPSRWVVERCAGLVIPEIGMKITGFTGWLVEHEPGPKFIWRDGLPGSYADIPQGTKPRKAVIRMETDEGLFGAIEVTRGDAVIDLVRRRYHEFIGENPLLTERLWRMIWEIDRVEEIHMRSLGLLDILCWDVKSQAAKMPIYQMLGGDDRVVPAYASTVTWPTMDEYERYIKMSRDLGFTAFKLHAWGDVKRDIELSTNLRRWVGPDADLMFDGSAGWDYVNALEFGKAIQALGFLWYEEPMREFHLGAYTKLCEKLDIPILAAETSDGVHGNMASWIEARALDMTRVSSFYKGGFTGSMKVAHLSESHGMRAQVHGMGLENAQICAAISNNDYYEQLIMNEEQIKGLDKLGPLAIVDGNLTVSNEPGLGYRCDWASLDAAALAKVEVTERLTPQPVLVPWH